MILELDAGNTALKWRVLDSIGQSVAKGGFTYADWPTQLAELPELLGQTVLRVRVSCVASPVIQQQIADWVEACWQVPVECAATQKHWQGLTVAYQDPTRLGVDRWLAMLAAREQAAGSGVCVIDCGSALTLDVVTAAGQHLGGYIVPGLEMMKASLLDRTGQIQWLDESANEATKGPGLGSTTEQAIDWGVVRMARALIVDVLAELAPADYQVFLAGGGVSRLQTAVPPDYDVKHNVNLVLDGLAVALP